MELQVILQIRFYGKKYYICKIMTEQEKIKREIKFIELAGIIVGGISLYLAYRRFKITSNGTTK